jgi:hypothetical protein
MENALGQSTRKMEMDAVVRAATQYTSQASVLRIDRVSTRTPLFLVPRCADRPRALVAVSEVGSHLSTRGMRFR